MDVVKGLDIEWWKTVCNLGQLLEDTCVRPIYWEVEDILELT